MKRILRIFLWTALLPGGKLAAQSAIVAPEPPVELPPLLVEGTANNGPHWRYASFAGYEILSCCSDDTTEQFVREYWRLHQQFDQVVPAFLRSASEEPTTLIIYQKSRSESLSKEVMQALDRVQASSLNRGAGIHTPPNVNLRDADSSVLFSILDDSSLIPHWLGGAFSSGSSEGPRFVLSPEHIRALLTDRAPAPPPWFVEGFAGFFSEISSSGRTLQFDAAPWLTDERAEAVYFHPDALRPLLPLSELLIGHLPPPGSDSASQAYRDVWLAEAQLFVRWAWDSPGTGRRAALWQLADAAARQPMTEALFRHCFGVGFSDARDDLSDYLTSGAGKRLDLSFDRFPAPPDLDLRDANLEEIHRIKGDWARRTLRLIRERHANLLPVYVDQARSTLQRAYDGGEHGARLVTDLGLLYADIGDLPAARRYLEIAIAAGVVRPAALAQLAALRLTAAEAHPDGPGGHLSPAQVDSVLELVRAARKESPPQVLLYAVVSDLIRHLPGDPTEEERGCLTEGARLFPGFSAVVVSAAVWEIHSGDPQVGYQLIEMGLWTASDPERVRRLQSVRNALLGKPTK